MATPSSGEVVKDKDGLRDKEKVMKKGRVNSLFYSVSDTFKFLAATSTAIGMSLFAPALPAFTKVALNTGLKAAFDGLVAGSLPAAATAAAEATTTAATAAGATAVAGTAAAAAAGVGGAVAVAGLALVAAAAAFTLVAIASQYISSRAYQNANFDALEVNAKHTARYLSKELQADNKCLTEEKTTAPARSDGKSWAQYVDARKAQQQHASQQIH